MSRLSQAKAGYIILTLSLAHVNRFNVAKSGSVAVERGTQLRCPNDHITEGNVFAKW